MSTIFETSPTHLADWFRNHATMRPNAVAIVTPSELLTYRGFYRTMLAATHRLAECGIEAGQTVAVCSSSPGLYYVMLVALNRMGCVSLGLNWPDRAGNEIELPYGIHVDRILVEQPCPGIALPNAIHFDLSWLQTADSDQKEWPGAGFTDPHMLAHIFTSSGTTGVAKAVGVSMQQLVKRVHWRIPGFEGVGEASRSLCRFGFVGVGFKKAFSMFCRGGTTFMGWHGNTIPEVIAKFKIQEIEGSPAHFAGMLGLSGLSSFDLSSLKHVSVAGSTVPQTLVASIRSNFARAVTVEYGAAELGTLSFGPLREEDPLGSSGYLAPWAQAECVDDDDKVLPPGVEGILRFRCAGMPTRYLNDELASAKHFRNGWFYPGDTGTLSEAKALIVTGRSVERINAGGHKVSPEVIENAIRSYPGIEDCGAFGVPGKLDVEEIWVALVLRPPIEIEGLRQHCRLRLGASAPKRFLIVSAIPRNAAGKIVRSNLQELGAAHSAPKSS